MFAGLLLIILASLLVQFLNMEGMSFLINSISAVWVIAFVIIFQPELRRILVYIGQSRIIRMLFKVEENRAINAVAETAAELADRHYGGLIVMQKDFGLKGIIETGVKLQSEISPELIVSIFSPRSPLHDGAVIIGNDLIQAAKCILPLTQNPTIDLSMGTRHRAALGITEESDAIAIVVSEETGKISMAFQGEFVHRNLETESLKKRLTEIYESNRVQVRKNRPDEEA